MEFWAILQEDSPDITKLNINGKKINVTTE